ncbi:unnamed protein product [Symbiodinium natans]|uniref:Uncharacterized protein n=1 Tax=Symbiodinium natans TaxID=878477 RepID=A0A812Q739_9DINO|nr:unnamed protein product [Symbiodinium natans]
MASEEDQNCTRQTSITWGEFYKLVQRFFCSYPDPDMLAVLKRAIVLVFGKRALYLCLPSEDKEAPIHLIQTDDLHVDLFSDGDKPYYAKMWRWNKRCYKGEWSRFRRPASRKLTSRMSTQPLRPSLARHRGHYIYRRFHRQMKKLGQFNLPSSKRRLTSKTSATVPVEESYAADPDAQSMPSSSSCRQVASDQEATQLLDPGEEAAAILHG